ncbi:MAG: butyrate kinase [Spirochaetia bacterium]|jgi:butyrate kinase
MGFTILAINPGSTSTKCAIYRDTEEAWKKGVSHTSDDLSRFRRLQDQLELRSTAVRNGVLEAGIPLSEISAVVGRGGLLKPLAGGVYEVNDQMKADLIACKYGTHASNLGALIADSLASELGIKAYIVDPVVVDELDPVARYSGIPEIPRRSIFHALNQKAIGRKAAQSIGKPYAECRMIVAHMGGGTSIGIHVNGRVADVNNALDGDGPFSIERAGTVPAGDWMRWVLSHQHDPQALQLMLTGKGGLVAYLGTNDFPLIERSAGGAGELDQSLSNGLIEALCYQVSKSIAGLAAFTEGRLDAIALTGGLAFSARVVHEITRRISFLGPVLTFPGENELEALAMGAREVLTGDTLARTYEG